MPTTATIRKPMQCALSQDELLARLEDHRATVNALRDLDEERKFVMRQLAERKKRFQAEERRSPFVITSSGTWRRKIQSGGLAHVN